VIVGSERRSLWLRRDEMFLSFFPPHPINNRSSLPLTKPGTPPLISRGLKAWVCFPKWFLFVFRNFSPYFFGAGPSPRDGLFPANTTSLPPLPPSQTRFKPATHKDTPLDWDANGFLQWRPTSGGAELFSFLTQKRPSDLRLPPFFSFLSAPATCPIRCCDQNLFPPRKNKV